MGCIKHRFEECKHDPSGKELKKEKRVDKRGRAPDNGALSRKGGKQGKCFVWRWALVVARILGHPSNWCLCSWGVMGEKSATGTRFVKRQRSPLLFYHHSTYVAAVPFLYTFDVMEPILNPDRDYSIQTRPRLLRRFSSHFSRVRAWRFASGRCFVKFVPLLVGGVRGRGEVGWRRGTRIEVV